MPNGLSPFTQGILKMAWSSMFTPESPLFLPDFLQRGDVARRIPGLDPLTYAGPSPEIVVPVPADAGDAACASAQYEHNPIAASHPSLQLMSARIRGLYALSAEAGSLTFSTTAPELTATLRTGIVRGARVPLTIDSAGAANYAFAVECCVPVEADTRRCSGTRWKASASGKFSATIRESLVKLTLRADFPPSGKPPEITVVRMTIDVPAAFGNPPEANIKVEFDIADLDPDYAMIAEIAVEEGIAADAVQKTLQSYFDGAPFKATLSKLITSQLAAAVSQVS